MNQLLRQIPQISVFLEKFKGRFPTAYVKRAAELVTNRYREEIKEGIRKTIDGIFEEVEKEILRLRGTNLRKVVNATGVVINTNLGRAPLPGEALEFIKEVASSYSNLEFDLIRGVRGSRISHVEDYLLELTGAEAVHVVNNNASAVFLVLNTVAYGKEVVISRSELVEIGGSFRIPSIMEKAGAVLREVGTTNRTRISDYQDAIGDNTALLMKVHRSNFHIEGFVEDVSIKELSRLGSKVGITTYYDLGSGLVVDPDRLGLKGSETSFKKAIRDGADVVSGSGDKLLGGPQAGIIAGKREIVEGIRRNPISRAMRIDKMTLAGLEVVLRMYLEGRWMDIPVLAMLTEPEEKIRQKALKLKRLLKGIDGLKVEVLRDISKPGGGSFPELELPTWCVACTFRDYSAKWLSDRLRLSDPPVVGRIKKEKLLIDLRTVCDEDLKLIRKSFEHLNY